MQSGQGWNSTVLPISRPRHPFNTCTCSIMDDDEPPFPSQASSHFTLEPVSASTVAENETRRRDANQRLGACCCGCSEVDDYTLLGGVERGSIVGVSSEEESFGLTVSFGIDLSEKTI